MTQLRYPVPAYDRSLTTRVSQPLGGLTPVPPLSTTFALAAAIEADEAVPLKIGRLTPAAETDTARPLVVFRDTYGAAIGSESGLERFFRMSDQDAVMRDYSPNQTNGDYQGSPSQLAAGLPQGSDGLSVSFDGVDDLATATVPRASAGQAFTVEAWVQPDVVQDFDNIVLWTGTGGVACHLFLMSDGVQFDYGGGTLTELRDQSGALSTADPSHLVATYDGTNLNLYRDGVLVAGPVDPAEDGPDGDVGLTVGAVLFGVPVFQFDGRIDELAVYSRALSLSEVQAHFSLGSAVTLTPAVEVDSATVMAPERVVTLSTAVETDSAQALATSVPKTLTAAVELDAAQALSVSGAKTLTPAVELDSGVGLVRQLHFTLGAAAETDSAQNFTTVRFVSLAFAAEVDQALTIFAPGTVPDTVQPTDVTVETYVRTVQIARTTTVTVVRDTDAAVFARTTSVTVPDRSVSVAVTSRTTSVSVEALERELELVP